MSLNDFVESQVTLSNASSPTVAGLNTGCIAAYHNHYPDRFRLYSTQSMLEQMVLDGFSVNEGAYKCAEAYASAPSAPALCGIGRRALPPFQSLQLTCVDGTVGDAYDFKLVGSTGVTSTIHYVNTAKVGSAVTGTVSVTNGSTAITFSGTQTMSKGDLLVFSSQPGVFYALASSVSSTSGTLTTAFSGTTAAAATATRVATMTVTFDTVPGNATVATSATSVGQVAVGDSVQFVTQLGTFYTVATVTSAHIILTTPYTGVGGATDNASDMFTAGTAATAIVALIEAIPSYLGTIGTVAVTGAVITIIRTDGQLTDVQGWVENGFASVQLADLTADPGIATDLAAIQSASNGGFYALLLDSNSANEIAAAGAFIEATGKGGKIFFTNNSDYGNIQTAVTSDVFTVLHGLSLSKTLLQQNNQQLLSYGGASICSYALSQFPGSYNLAYKEEPDVPADSDTTLTESQALALNTMTASNPGPGGKFGNYYKSQGGENFLFPGCAPSGQFFDLTIGIDDLVVTMQVNVLAAIQSLPKTPFDDFGLGIIGDAVRTTLVSRSGAPYGLILPDGQDPARPIQVNVPKASSLTSEQRATRNVSAITYSAGIQGAIDTATSTGQLAQ